MCSRHVEQAWKMDVCLLWEGNWDGGLAGAGSAEVGATAAGRWAGDPAASAQAAQEGCLICCVP